MTSFRRVKFPDVQYAKGFTIAELLVTVLIAGILLTGAYKVFVGYARQSSQIIEFSLLDDKTRRAVTLIRSDIEDVNGNILKGIPTIFPSFDSKGKTNGFVLFKSERRLPVLELQSQGFAPPRIGETKSLELSSSVLNNVNIDSIKPGMVGVLYNFRNYSWVPHKIESIFHNNQNTFTLHVKRLASRDATWVEYLATEPCQDFQALDQHGSDNYVCSESQYRKENTVFIVFESVEYSYREGKLVRILNVGAKKHDESITVISDSITQLSVDFVTSENIIYPQAKAIIRSYKDVEKYLLSLIPGNKNIDDCEILFGYKCFNESSKKRSITPVGYSYLSSNIGGVKVSLGIKSNKIKEKIISFYLSLDKNRGSSALSFFNHTKISAKRHSKEKRFGSLTTSPSVYQDPLGGTAGNGFIYAALSTDYVHKNEDRENDAILYGLCNYCLNDLGNCDGYPDICMEDKDDNAINDGLECLTTTREEKRAQLNCINPIGSLNDRRLRSEMDSPHDNRINPKVVFFDATGNISKEWGLGPECSENCHLFNSWYNRSGYFSEFADTVNPLSIFPFYNSKGKLQRVYIGASRLRFPDENNKSTNYYPFYRSMVFSLDPETPTTSSVIYGNPSSPDDADNIFEDIASVHQLSIREERGDFGNVQYMYMSSNEANKVVYRTRPADSLVDLDWSRPNFAFHDRTAVFRVKYSFVSPGTYGYSEVLIYPNDQDDFVSNGATVEYPRISAMYPHPDGKIYFCTPQMLPDTEIDYDGYFYQNNIRYTAPIINPSDGNRYACDPQARLHIDSHNYHKCFLKSGEPKPIDWGLCVSEKHRKECWDLPDARRPHASEILPDFSGTIKAAVKIKDDDWMIYKIANVHGSCNGITSDPLNGDILVAGNLNLVAIPYSDANSIIAKQVQEPYMDVPRVDLEFKKGLFYSANNDVSFLSAPESPSTDVEIRKISGINVQWNTKKLIMAFSDSVNSITGHIVQERNPDDRKVFAQILYNDKDGNLDRNLDAIAVFPKGVVEPYKGLAQPILPVKSTKVWADHRKNYLGEAQYPKAQYIPARPPVGVTDYRKNDPFTKKAGGWHDRLLSDGDRGCYCDPEKPNECGNKNVCSQHKYYRECSNDLTPITMSAIQGGNTGSYHCGINYPSSTTEDPNVLDYPSLMFLDYIR